MKQAILVIVVISIFWGCKEEEVIFTDSSDNFNGISSGQGVTPNSVPTSSPTVVSVEPPSEAGFGDQGVPSVDPVFPDSPVFPDEPTEEGNALCRKTFVVHFRFVLDITTSMRDVFPVIKSNANAFAQNAVAALKSGSTENITPLFSLTTFEDGAPNRATHQNLESLNSFVQRMSSLEISKRTDNGDWPENGVTALESLISTKIDPTSVLNVVIFISDNFAHRGGAKFSRDFSLSSLRNAVSNKVSETPILFFDATLNSIPTDDPHLRNQLLPSYATVPADQWNVARDQSPGKLIGKGIGFPLNSSSLVIDIPSFIEDHKTETCL